MVRSLKFIHVTCMHDSCNMQGFGTFFRSETCTDYCQYFMHGTCMKRMHISCMKLAHSMHDTGIYIPYMFWCITYVVLAFSMRGTGVLRAPCTVQA